MKKIVLILIILIVHCTLTIEDCSCQWFYQPIGASGTPLDMKFFDANTGYISTNSQTVFKTTTGGNNWVLEKVIYLYCIEKINDSIMYCRGSRQGTHKLFKITQKGQRWDSINFPPQISFAVYTSMSFVNKDTGWICGFDGNVFHVWRTTDGGVTFQSQTSAFGFGPIFFLKKKINGEYHGWCSHYEAMYKTTNSGVNWFPIAGIAASANQICMLNENTGWIAIMGADFLSKTTNGGLGWIQQPMPNIPNVLVKYIDKICVINNNLIYGIGGERWFGPGIGDGIIWKTTDGGSNWGFQQPDTSYPITKYYAVDFIDSSNGWAYGLSSQGGVHTTNGGGQIIYTGNKNLSNEIPEEFKLYQNYPNPFNSMTKIKFSIPPFNPPLIKGGRGLSSGGVSLKVYDILGKEVSVLVNESALGGQPGTYEVTFNGSKFPSGIYFYTLTAGDFKETKRMSLIK